MSGSESVAGASPVMVEVPRQPQIGRRRSWKEVFAHNYCREDDEDEDGEALPHQTPLRASPR